MRHHLIDHRHPIAPHDQIRAIPPNQFDQRTAVGIFRLHLRRQFQRIDHLRFRPRAAHVEHLLFLFILYSDIPDETVRKRSSQGKSPTVGTYGQSVGRRESLLTDPVGTKRCRSGKPQHQGVCIAVERIEHLRRKHFTRAVSPASPCVKETEIRQAVHVKQAVHSQGLYDGLPGADGPLMRVDHLVDGDAVGRQGLYRRLVIPAARLPGTPGQP